MSKLKKCPCGKRPTSLGIMDGGKYAYVSGDCCGEWMVEFFNDQDIRSAKCMEFAIEAWNKAPREE